MPKALTKFFDCCFLLRIPLLAPVWTVLMLGWVTGTNQTRIGGWVVGGEAALQQEALLWLALVGFSLTVASIYVVNQIMDIESDRINHKLFLLPQGIIAIRTAWVLATVCALGGLAIALIFFDLIMVGLFAVSLVLGALYNVPPVELKARALGGTLANFLGHGVLTYLVGWYAANIGGTLDREAVLMVLIASLSPGFANAAVYITTTIADADGDRQTGKRTFSVVYGETVTAIVATLFCVAAVVFALRLPCNQWVMAVPSVLSLALFLLLVFFPRRENAFKAFKWPVFLLTLFVALFVPFYAVLILATFFGSRLYYARRFGIEYPTFKAQ